MLKMRTPLTSILVVLPLLVVSNAQAKSTPQKDECLMGFDPAQVKVEWTGYKTTEKLGAKGTFADLKIHGKNQGKSVDRILSGLRAEINALSVQSGNEARDLNLRETFFGLLAKKAQIQGQIRKVKGTQTQGQFELDLRLNGKQKAIPMQYVVKDSVFEATGELDVLDFGAKSPLEALAQRCLELHKGKDGVSKTWSTVSLRLEAPVHQRGACVSKASAQ